MEGCRNNADNLSDFQSSRKRESYTKDDVNLPLKKQIVDSNFEDGSDKFSSKQCPSASLITDFVNVPNEILTYVFEFLPLRDRKNVKLVCRQWNAACNVWSLLRYEKIIFHGIFYNENQLLKLVEEHTSEFLNLEIREAVLMDVKSVWKLYGYKITFLKFVTCKVSDETFETIITYCDNLKELHWKGYSFNFTNTLELLLSKNIVKKNLTSFFVHINDDVQITDYTFYALFNIFPNIKKFVFKCDKWSPYHDTISMGQQQHYSKIELTGHGAMQKIIDSSAVMETFGFKLFEPVWKIISSTNFIRLKHLDVYIPIEVPNELLFTFFKRHTRLESVSCNCIKMEDFPKEFLLLLLNSCPNLRNLKLKFLASIGLVIDKNLYDKLAVSNLQTLTIFSRNIRLCGTLSSYVLRVNNTLETLKLPLVSVEEVLLLFVRTFRNLKVFEFPCLSPAVNTEIAQCQTNLKNLNLIGQYDRYLPTSWLSIGRPWCRSRDKSPKNVVDSSAVWVPDSFSLFSSLSYLVSRLNTLRIVICQWNNTNDTMEKCLRNATNLEVLSVHWRHCLCDNCPDCNYVYESWLDACCNLPNLRCLQIMNTWKSSFFTEQIYQAMFHRCSSLRFLNHKNGSSSNFFFFDCVKKKVISDSTSSFFFDKFENRSC